MKILLDKYPKGTYKGQRTDGRYIDNFLYHNLELLADKIVDDMTFMGVCYSSTLEVGTGKSVFCTQIGEAWTEIMKRKHNIDLPYGMNNIVWKPQQLIERAFEVPRYSFVLMDEWEDATYWSELGMALRKFFRKCRQLNLFIMVIIPNWFQLPLPYAVSRSAFAIDVRFQDGFERGHFYFYGFEAKRMLYIKGKRDHNYKVARPDFYGRFLDGYGVPEKEYRAAKLKDMMEEDTPTKDMKPRDWKAPIVVKKIYDAFHIPQIRLSKALGVSQQMISRWLAAESTEPYMISDIEDSTQAYNSKQVIKEVVWDEEKLGAAEEIK